VIDQAPSHRNGFVTTYLDDVSRCLHSIEPAAVERFLTSLERAYEDDRQIFIIGNGGSASTSTHIACDLAKNVTPYSLSSAPQSQPIARRLRVISLTDNVALITAVANDCGYEHVFSQQLTNLLQKDDLVIAISATGNSPNILHALRLARDRRAHTAALLGFGGGRARDLVEVALVVQSDDYGHVEDLHLVMCHLARAWMHRFCSQSSESVQRHTFSQLQTRAAEWALSDVMDQ